MTNPKSAARIRVVDQIGGTCRALVRQGNLLAAGIGYCVVLLDIADDAQPRVIGQSEPLDTNIKALALDGDTAFAGTMLWVYALDIRQTERPLISARHEVNGYVAALAAYGDYAYVMTDNGFYVLARAGLRSLASPRYYRKKSPTPSGNLSVDGNILYAAYGSGLDLFALDDPARPRLIGSWTATGEARTSADLVALAPPYAYVGGSDGLHVLDCAAPTRPVEVGGFLTGGGIADIACAGNHVYATAGESGVYVIDVSDAARPSCCAHLTGFHWADSVAHKGRTLYVADQAAFDEPSLIATRRSARDDALSLVDVADVRLPRHRTFPFAFRYAAAVATDGERLVVLDGESARAGLRTLQPGAADRLVNQSWRPAQVRQRAVAAVGEALIAAGPDQYSVYRPEPDVDDERPYHRPQPVVGLGTKGAMAYLLSFHHLQALDLADPEHPIVRHRLRLEPGGKRRRYATSHQYFAKRVAVGDRYVYAEWHRMLYIIDPDVTTGPAVIGSYAVPDGATDIAVAEPYVYLASGADLEVVDTTDPRQPALIARVEVAIDLEWEESGIHNIVWVGYVYATQGDSILAVDVRDPARPTFVGSFWTWDMGITKPMDLASDGSTCYAACQESGVLLLRVEDARSGSLRRRT